MLNSDPKRTAAGQGVKHDQGKPRAHMVLTGFSRALLAVSRVGTFGADKYSDEGWLTVPNGVGRYGDALVRHLLEENIGEGVDPESQLLIAAHTAWNALARLELMLRAEEDC